VPARELDELDDMDELGKYLSILLVRAGHITYFLILQVSILKLDLIRFGKYLAYAYYKSQMIY
jgi:hypothetical protein